MKLLELLRHRFRRLGFDVVRFPYPGSLGAHLRRLFPRLGVDCVLDVGAHTGEYGRFLRDVVGYRGRILSFEPLRGSFEALAAASDRDPHWTAHRLALGDSDGETALRVMRGTVFSSFLAPSTYARQRFGEGVEVERMEPVPVRRLDGALGELLGGNRTSRIFLKIDVQGSERKVVRGADGCLDRIVLLQTETAVRPTYRGAPRVWELIPELEERGFRLTGLFPVSLDRGDLSLVELDAVAVRTEVSTPWKGESPP
jgi:FkbM family methyltransferase